jgi:hypothetical protein
MQGPRCNVSRCAAVPMHWIYSQTCDGCTGRQCFALACQHASVADTALYASTAALAYHLATETLCQLGRCTPLSMQSLAWRTTPSIPGFIIAAGNTNGCGPPSVSHTADRC